MATHSHFFHTAKTLVSEVCTSDTQDEASEITTEEKLSLPRSLFLSSASSVQPEGSSLALSHSLSPPDETGTCDT